MNDTDPSTLDARVTARHDPLDLVAHDATR